MDEPVYKEKKDLPTCEKEKEDKPIQRQMLPGTFRLETPRVSLIVPVYNEETSIAFVLKEIEQFLMFYPSTEVIVVDDGSIDDSANEISKFPFVKCITHTENRGKGAALRTGLSCANGDILIIQDSDLEYPISNIPALLEPILDEQADVVYGSRFKGKIDVMSPSHYVGNRILSLTASFLFHTMITDIMTGHKCFKRSVIQSLSLEECGFAVEIEITAKVLKNGWRLVEVPIEYYRRGSGSSKIRYIDGIRSLLKLLEVSIS